jgi:tetratricopeptide (TPR) repeat protein
MRAENLLGAVAWEAGQVGDAERCFGTALELAHGLDDSLMTARASNNLASVAHLTGRPDLALSLYRTALLSYQRLGDRRGMAETSHNLGIAFRQLGQWTDAERAAEEAVRHADQSGDAALRGLALVGLAELHLELKAWPLAEREIERAAFLAADGKDPIGVAEAGRLRALLHLGLGHAVAALREALAARDEAHRLGTALLEAECTSVAARAARALGNGDQAEGLRAEAEAGLTRLGAAGLLERLRKQWGA